MRYPVLDAACVLLCLVAAVIDVRSYRIPNWLTFPAVPVSLALAFVLAALEGGPMAGLTDGLVPALATSLGLFIVFLILGLLRIVGMGDVKLMASVGALLGWPLGAAALFYTILVGGVLALGIALARGQLGHALSNLARMARRPRRAHELRLSRVPYGCAILGGVAWAVGSRYLPALRLLE